MWSGHVTLPQSGRKTHGTWKCKVKTLILWCQKESLWLRGSAQPLLHLPYSWICILSTAPFPYYPFFFCNYAPWLFVSMQLQQQPAERRLEKPIACSQQIKEGWYSSSHLVGNSFNVCEVTRKRSTQTGYRADFVCFCATRTVKYTTAD